MEELMTYAGVAVVALVIQILLFRWIFRVNEKIALQRATFEILLKLAEKQGVEENEVERIIGISNP